MYSRYLKRASLPVPPPILNPINPPSYPHPHMQLYHLIKWRPHPTLPPPQPQSPPATPLLTTGPAPGPALQRVRRRRGKGRGRQHEEARVGERRLERLLPVGGVAVLGEPGFCVWGVGVGRGVDLVWVGRLGVDGWMFVHLGKATPACLQCLAA